MAIQYYKIDNDFRTITAPSSPHVLGAVNDKDVHRLYFRMPSMIDNEDLSEFTIFVNYQNAAGTKDRYEVDDKTISKDDNYIYFSWLVGASAFVKAGTGKFSVRLVRFNTINEDGLTYNEVYQEFNTEITDLPPVVDSLVLDDNYDVYFQSYLDTYLEKD